jgi:cellobiose phosphorylase
VSEHEPLNRKKGEAWATYIRRRQEAYASAYDEAADHLILDWTDDALEREIGQLISDQLRAKAAFWTAKSQQAWTQRLKPV